MKPTMKKCRRGKGIRLTASLRRSAFSCPAGRGVGSVCRHGRQQDWWVSLWKSSADTCWKQGLLAGPRCRPPKVHKCAGRSCSLSQDCADMVRGLTREAQAAGHAGHDCGDEVVQVTEGGGGQLQGAEADVVQSLVIQDLQAMHWCVSSSLSHSSSATDSTHGMQGILPCRHCASMSCRTFQQPAELHDREQAAHHALISILDQLVDGQGGVVGLHHCVGHLGRGHD